MTCRVYPRPYVHLQLLATRIQAMKLHVLFWAALSCVPLAASVKVEECLSERLIGSLPTEMQNLAIGIRDLLVQPNSKLRLEKSQTWGPDDLELFTNDYFPKLEALVEETLKQSFVGGVQGPLAPPLWPRDLRGALKCLVPVGDIKSANISATALTSLVEVVAAKLKLVCLFETFDEVYERVSLREFNDQQWELEASIFDLQMKIQVIFRLIEKLAGAVVMLGPGRSSPFQLVNLDGGENLAHMERLLDKLTRQLELLFSRLQPAVSELATGCTNSWVFSNKTLWKSFPNLSSKSSRLAAVLDGLQAKCLSKTILLNLEIAKFVDPLQFSFGLDQGELTNRLINWTKGIYQSVKSLSTNAHEFVHQQISTTEDLVAGVRKLALTLFDSCLETNMPLNSMLNYTWGLKAQVKSGSTLKPEAVEGLRRAYRVAKQLVESFAAVLHLANERIKEDAGKDSFLLGLFRFEVAAQDLELAKGIMDNAEEALDYQLGPDVQRYGWDDFPLKDWYRHSQTEGADSVVAIKGEEGAPKRSALGTRGRDQGADNDVPGAKRAKHSGDEKA